MNPRFNRRSFLAGLGASGMLLPMLHSEAEAADGFPKRFIVCVWPDGVLHPQWWPTGTTTDFVLPSEDDSPLAPLEPFRDRLIVCGGIDYQNLIDHEMGQLHAAMPFMLTGVEGASFDGKISDQVPLTAGGPSVDQFIAGQLQKQTPLAYPSLVTRPYKQSGDDQWISFRGGPVGGKPNAETPWSDPVLMYDSLFGGSDLEQVAAIRRRQSSILDYVGDSLSRFTQRLGTEDRAKTEAHLQAIREVELQLAGDLTCAPGERPSADVDWDTHHRNPNLPAAIRHFTDMTVLAMACDMSRVGSMLWTNSHNSNVTFFWLGDEFTEENPSDANGNLRQHHEISHKAGSGNDLSRPEVGMKNRIDQWFVEQFAHLIQKLDSVPEGDGTMLDNTVVLLANCGSNGANHGLRDVPWTLAGSCGGYFQTGRYHRMLSGTEQGVPQNGVLTHICRAMGVEVEAFGDPKYHRELDVLRA